HVRSKAEADEHKMGFGLLLVDAADLLLEVGRVVQLDVIRLVEAQRLDVVTDPGQVRQVHRVGAVDEEDVDVVAAAAGRFLARVHQLGGWRRHRMTAAQTSFAGQDTCRQETYSQRPTPLLRSLHAALPGVRGPCPGRAAPSAQLAPSAGLREAASL